MYADGVPPASATPPTAPRTEAGVRSGLQPGPHADARVRRNQRHEQGLSYGAGSALRDGVDGRCHDERGERTRRGEHGHRPRGDSAAIAEAHGYPDGERIPADLMLAAVGRVVRAVDLPVTADLESGYGDVERTIRSAVQLGVVGADLEDGMRPLTQAVRVEDAVRAAGAEGVSLVLNARTDCYLLGEGRPAADLLAEAVRRGRAYLDAGADRVFVPGCTDVTAIRSLVERFGHGRLSILGSPGARAPHELQELGVARVSYGPYPHRHVLAALVTFAAGVLDASAETGA